MTSPSSRTAPSTRGAAEVAIEALRPALTGYCYRMLGSGIDAEDAVQEALVRAWRHHDQLHDGAALKAWTYRIATNVCYDLLQGRSRRALPIDLSDPRTADTQLGAPLTESAWVLPVADTQLGGDPADPAALVGDRETLRLAFIAALQHLPARQRSVLVLRDVLRWSAREVAELLETTVASVNSALQRARATLDALDLDAADAPGRMDDVDEQALLTAYLEAFEAYDIDRLVTLLRQDVVFDMPPFAMWVRGSAEAGRFMLGQGAACRGSRTIPVRANGGPAFGSYKPNGDGTWSPWSLTVLEMHDGQVTAVRNALQPLLPPGLFTSFGLPERLTADDPPR